MNLPDMDFGCCCDESSGSPLGYLPTRTPWIYNGVKYPNTPIRWSTSLAPYIDETENNYGFPAAIIAPIIAAGAALASTGISVGAGSASSKKARKAEEAAMCPGVAQIDKQIATLKPEKGGLFNTGLFSFNGVGKSIKSLKKERKVAAADCTQTAAQMAQMAQMPQLPAAESGVSPTVIAIGVALLSVLALGGVALARRSA